MKRSLLPSAFCLLLILAGCPSSPTPTPLKPDADAKPAPVVSDLQQQFATARNAARLTMADKLDAIADEVDAGTIKYDSKLAQRLEQAGRDAGQPIADLMAKQFGDGALADKNRCAKSLRDAAAGYRK